VSGARSWMIYGASGHAGAMIARHVHQRGHLCELHERAEGAGITIIPGVGFGVVATIPDTTRLDCLPAEAT
jgi:short subunit dehydrogenase-like uncharacterized protein